MRERFADDSLFADDISSSKNTFKPVVSPELHSSPDRTVGGQDLATLLSLWGVCESDGPLDCLADFDGNGIVNGADLATILSAWGVCSN